jgi:hypothetical protein
MNNRLLLIAFFFGLAWWSTPPTDPDLGWHLLGGSLILDLHALPVSDPINAFRPIWHDYHWFGQILMALVFRWGGYQALQIALGILGGFLSSMLMLTVIKANRHIAPWMQLLLWFSGALMVGDLVSIRPQMIALCICSFAFYRLTRASSRFELAILFVAVTVLANLHVYWVIIPLFWFCFRAVPRVIQTRHYSPAYAWGGLFLLSSAGLWSPYGLFQEQWSMPRVLTNYALIYEYLGVPAVLRRTIEEFRSILSSTSFVRWLVLASLVIGTHDRLSRQRLRGRLPILLLATCFTALTLMARKYVGLLSIVQGAYLARCSPTVRFGRIGRVSRFQTIALNFLLVAAAGRACWLSPFINDAPLSDGLYQAYPVEACSALTSLAFSPRPDGAPTRVLTHFDDGGWCSWALYSAHSEAQFRMTTDNRTQGVPEEHYQQSLDLFSVRHSWRQTLRDWDPDAAVLSTEHPLANVMLLDTAGWTLRKEVSGFALFQRNR